jgi:hypothetical protein
MTRTDESIINPDFLALGLGGTNMMAMLWTVVMGRQAVGVEMRGDPFLGVHWNIREDLYHQFGLIDQLMLERYGEARIPRRGNGQLFRLAECFYSPSTRAGDIVADEIIDGFDIDQHIVGTIHHVEFIDDRWRDGLPNRVITVLDPPVPPDHPDPQKIRTNMVEVLDGPSTFQAEAASIQKLLRRYLERIEQLDRESGQKPRVRLYTHHRVVPTEGDGFIRQPDGRLRIRIEALKEFDFKGQFVRVREPGSTVIDLGIPELFMIAEGFHSSDAQRLGFQQHDVKIDHRDGRGPVVAQADFLAGLIEVLIGGRLRRRIASAFDREGREYWVRQIAVGHENDPEVGWVLVQVPDFQTFDPIEAGLVPPDTDSASPEFFAAYQQLLYDYYIKQASETLDIPAQELTKVQMIYGPVLFSLVERVGDDALIAPNGVVAGDTFGNGHFLTSGGAMTGMIGHSFRVLQYWQERDAGSTPAEAIRRLADHIKEDTHAWLQVSATEYSQAAPINFGAERIQKLTKASGIDADARANLIEAARRQRHALIPLDPSNWRRLFVRNGRVLSALPELETDHPMLRPEREASLMAIMKTLSATPATEQKRAGDEKTLLKPKPDVAQQTEGEEQTLIDIKARMARQMAKDEQTPLKLDSTVAQQVTESEQTLLRARPAMPLQATEGEQTLISTRLVIGDVKPKSATTYAFLEIQQQGGRVQRLEIKEKIAIIGRSDLKHGIKPDIDLTPFDSAHSVSRRHARIHLEKAFFYIEDLKSRNGIRLGEKTLVPFKPAMLHDGDLLYFGSVKATFRLLGTSELPVAWSPS